MNDDKKIEFIREIIVDWVLQKIDGDTAMGRVMIVANICEPSVQDMEWARKVLTKRLKEKRG